MLGRGVKSTSNVIKVIWLSSGGLVVVIPLTCTHFTSLRAIHKGCPPPGYCNTKTPALHSGPGGVHRVILAILDL